MSLVVPDSTTLAAVRAATDQEAQLAALIAPWAGGDVTCRVYVGSTHAATVTHGPWSINTGVTPRTISLGARSARTPITTGTPTSVVFRAGSTDIFSLSAGVGSGDVSFSAALTSAASERLAVTVTANAGLPVNGLPAWLPDVNSAAQIGYTSGNHPSGLYATLDDASPLGKSWNPAPATLGPWAGTAPYSVYNWSSILAYGGGAWDQQGRRWIGFGAGHSAVCVPAPFAFSLGTLSWDWLATPLPTDNLEQLNKAGLTVAQVQAIYPIEQYIADTGEWQGDWSGWPTGFDQPGKIFVEPPHSYYSLVVIPGSVHGNSAGVLLTTGNPSGSATSGDAKSNHFFDFDTGQWVRTNGVRPGLPSATAAVAGGAIFYAGSVNKVFALTHVSSTVKSEMHVYDPAARTWSATTATAAIDLPIEGGGFGAHLPSGLLLSFCPETSGGTASYLGVRHRVYAVSAAAAAAGSHTWSLLTVSASSWPTKADGTIAAIGWCFCPLDGCFYALNGQDNSSTFWKLSPPAGAVTQNDYLAGTWTVSTITLAAPVRNRGGGGTGNTGGTYNRLVWDDVADVFIYVEEFPGSRVQAIRVA